MSREISAIPWLGLCFRRGGDRSPQPLVQQVVFMPRWGIYFLPYSWFSGKWVYLQYYLGEKFTSMIMRERVVTILVRCNFHTHFNEKWPQLLKKVNTSYESWKYSKRITMISRKIQIWLHSFHGFTQTKKLPTMWVHILVPFFFPSQSLVLGLVFQPVPIGISSTGWQPWPTKKTRPWLSSYGFGRFL